MNPDERILLERSLKLSEENNLILRRMQRTARWAMAWGFIKVLLIVVPLVVGYIYLQPFFGEAMNSFQDIKGIIELQR